MITSSKAVHDGAGAHKVQDLRQRHDLAGSYRTSNINFAAYLQASGRLRFDRVESHLPDSRHYQFVFDDPENLGPEIAQEFFTEDLVVSARASIGIVCS